MGKARKPSKSIDRCTKIERRLMLRLCLLKGKAERAATTEAGQRQALGCAPHPHEGKKNKKRGEKAQQNFINRPRVRCVSNSTTGQPQNKIRKRRASKNKIAKRRSSKKNRLDSLSNRGWPIRSDKGQRGYGNFSRGWRH